MEMAGCPPRPWLPAACLQISTHARVPPGYLMVIRIWILTFLGLLKGINWRKAGEEGIAFKFLSNHPRLFCAEIIFEFINRADKRGVHHCKSQR
jgi:hypothetical protein